MKRIITLCLTALVSLTMLAQSNHVTVLARSSGDWVPRPTAVAIKKLKKTAAIGPDTEKNDWYEQSLTLENVPTVKNLGELFPDLADAPKDMPYMPMPWMLTEEDGETVLHCYYRMPADIVTGFWLTDVEGGILDRETGITYRARRTVPECYEKLFAIKGKEDDVLDFKIFFPKLPETTKEIAIYGVPNWRLRGREVTLTRMPSELYVVNGSVAYYDTVPKFHKPQMVVEAKDYDKDNFRTWEEYKDPHLIKPVEEGTMAMWITPEATYVAFSMELNWCREYFGRGGNNILIDESGHQYKCTGVVDYPNDKLFWVQGYSGDYFAFVIMFEPIPPTLETITYIHPEGEPFHVRNASWKGSVRPNLSIKELRQNQRLFDYHPRVFVK